MKNQLSALLLGLFVALPVAAQDEMPVDESAAMEEAVVDESLSAEAPAEGLSEDMAAGDAMAEEGSADAAALDDPGVTDDTAASAEATAETTEEVPVDDGSSEVAADDSYEETTGTTGEPFKMYVGLDRAWATATFSNDTLAARFGGDEFDSEFYRVRIGARVFDAISLEAQIGVSDEEGSEPGKFEVAEYYGVFVVPTGVLFNLVEVAAPVGYSMMSVERGNVSEDIDGVSFGLNIEIPLLTGVEWLPDVRIGGGGTVYQAEKKSRVYGYHAGLRIDFGL